MDAFSISPFIGQASHLWIFALKMIHVSRFITGLHVERFAKWEQMVCLLLGRRVLTYWLTPFTDVDGNQWFKQPTQKEFWADGIFLFIRHAWVKPLQAIIEIWKLPLCSWNWFLWHFRWEWRWGCMPDRMLCVLSKGEQTQLPTRQQSSHSVHEWVDGRC